jgi:hypothetical protein
VIRAVQDTLVVVLLVEDENRLDLESGHQSQVAGDLADFVERLGERGDGLVNRLPAKAAAGKISRAQASELDLSLQAPQC